MKTLSICLPSKWSLLGSTQIHKITKIPSFLSKVTASYCIRVYWWFNYNGQKTRSIEHLGFVTDSQSMTISLTQKKKVFIKQLCQEVLQEEFLILRKNARLLGKFTSSFPAVRFGPLHYRSLERDKILALILAKGNFDKKMKVSQAGKMDILWWINNIEDSFSPIQIPNCSFFIKNRCI